MNWSEEFWIKLYRRMSPSFMAMHWQSRGLFRLVITELDPATGRLELGRLGLKAVSVAIHAPWEEVETFLQECLDDGCLAVDGSDLVCPNYLEAQQSAQTGAARMRKLRQARRLARDESSPKRDETQRDRDESSRERDAVTNTVTFSDESDYKRREEKRREDKISDPTPTPPASGKGKPRTVKTLLPDDWQPTPEHVELARAEGGRDASWVQDQARRMRDYAAGKGWRMVDWNATFRNWIRRALERVGGAPQNPPANSRPLPSDPRHVVIEPPPAMSLEETAASAAAGQQALLKLRNLVGEYPNG